MLVRCYWMGSGDKLLYNLFYSAWVELVHHTTNGIFDTPFWGFFPNTHDAPASSYKFMIAHINMDFFSLGHLNIHCDHFCFRVPQLWPKAWKTHTAVEPLSHSSIVSPTKRPPTGSVTPLLATYHRWLSSGSDELFWSSQVVMGWGLWRAWFPKCSIKIMCSTVCQKRHGLWEEGVSGSALHRLSEQLQGNLRVTQGCHNPPRNKALYTKRWLRP